MFVITIEPTNPDDAFADLFDDAARPTEERYETKAAAYDRLRELNSEKKVFGIHEITMFGVAYHSGWWHEING